MFAKVASSLLATAVVGCLALTAAAHEKEIVAEGAPLIERNTVENPEQRQPVQPPVGGEDDPLPQRARKLITDYDKDIKAIQDEAAKKVAARKKIAVEQLQKMQDEYTKPGQLDLAVAIRDALRRVKAGNSGHAADALPAPQNLQDHAGDQGKTYFYRVTGHTTGFVWGSDVYTADSDLATAAVHAGVLADGEQGIVCVTILPGLPVYAESTRHGVTSHPWQNFPGSYRVDPADR